MFKRMHRQDDEATVKIEFEGEEINADPNDMVSAALLASGVEFTGTTEKCRKKRAPYCQMGIGFECLVEIDGVANQQSCLIKVRDGMKVKRQYGIKSFPGNE